MALVTGKLAEGALRRVAGELEQGGTVQPSVVVMNIQVAALMTADWLSRKLTRERVEGVTRVILPGYCRGDVSALSGRIGVDVELGPKDLCDLPVTLGAGKRDMSGYGAHDIEIVAEINEASRLAMDELVALADGLREDGADVIDVGCDPYVKGSRRQAWKGVGDVVKALRDRDQRVSVDTFHPKEAAAAVKAGAELVLSVNSRNVRQACDWGAEVVVVPDDPRSRGYLSNIEKTINILKKNNVPHRVDPVVEPIGFGFAPSLGRYLRVRERLPGVEMMMGLGNLTELTAADSAGVNMLLVGLCQELGIRSVLTTQVINWARSSVREIDTARRLAYYAVAHGVLPKHLDDRLVQLRSPRLRQFDQKQLDKLARSLTDRNVRIFADHDTQTIHAMLKGIHAHGADPYEVFRQLGITEASHAFYLGYEMAKAATALTLAKNYTQDEPLDWGLHTKQEVSHHPRKKK